MPCQSKHEGVWKRPKPKNGARANPNGDVDFMMVDATYRIKPNALPLVSKLPYPEIPVIEIFGITATGNSVCAHVHGFLPRFYADSSALLRNPTSQHEDICETITTRMERLMKDRKAGKKGYRSGRGPTLAYAEPADKDAMNEYVHGVSTVRATSIYGHHEKPSDFVEITMIRPPDVPAARALINKSKKFSSLRNGGMNTTYEANVEFIIRFMIDAEITGCGWITAPKKDFKIRRVEALREGFRDSHPSVRESSCDLEFDIHWSDLIGRAPDDPDWQHVAPLVSISMDGEMRTAVKGHFPNHREPGDMVISIANEVKVLGEPRARELNVFMVGTSNPLKKPELRKGDPDLPEPVVYSFDTEADMLRAWYEYVNKIDADIITGWNTYGFDGEYVEERMNNDKIEVPWDDDAPQRNESFRPPYKRRRKQRMKKRTRVHRLGRLTAEQTRLKNHKFQNNAYGKKIYRLPTTPGRFQLDCLEAIRRDVTCKYRSYRLDAVADIILGLRKADVKYTEITPLFEGDDADRARLGEYNLMDVVLPDMLLEDKAYIFRFVEEARVCNVPIQWLLTKGQQVKVMAQILRETRKEGLLIPNNKRFDIDDNKKFEGAIVIDPLAGYYTDAVVVLDFVSLYPSIMRRWNLCYTTWIPPGPLRKKLKQEVDYDVAPNGHAFLKKEVKEGLLPRILGNLLDARGKAKKDMAEAAKKYGKNSPEYKKQNGRQNALKVAANSVYGFTGAMVGRLPCIPIASAVTAYGRQLIERTKVVVEALDPTKYKVIYGDTDSVMVRLIGVTDVREALDIGQELQDACDREFRLPIKIEREKVFLPYCLITKKRYAGLHWESADAPNYINSKGLISVRRDNALFASNLFSSCLETLYGYSNAFDSSPKFVESEYPEAERGDRYVVSDDGETCTKEYDEELSKREKGKIYAKIDVESGEILRPGWTVRTDGREIRVGDSVSTLYKVRRHKGGSIKKITTEKIASRTRGFVYAELDPITGKVLKPGWVRMKDVRDDPYSVLETRETVRHKEWWEMVGNSVQTAVDMVQETRERLWNGEIPLDLLTITKAFSREPSEYALKQAHVELALRMTKRDAGSAPKIGDRIPYVIVKKGKKTKLCEKSEDPAYVEQHGIPMDFEYYEEKQLVKPLTQLFAPVLAKQKGETYVAPDDDDIDEDEEMRDYVAGLEEEMEDDVAELVWVKGKDGPVQVESVFSLMKKGTTAVSKSESEVEKRARRVLFPVISRRKIEIKGASVLYDPFIKEEEEEEEEEDEEEMQLDGSINPYEFFSSIYLPPDDKKVVDSSRVIWKDRNKRVLNAFDVMNRHARRESESK